MPMAVYHNLREKRHKVFKVLAKKARLLLVGFFGFKLHFILNIFGEIISITITSKLIGDKGYI